VSRRPLVPVLGLAIGDYLLWNWSLNGNHDVLALIAGLTLPPIAVACVWLLALSAADLIASTVRRQPSNSSARGAGRRGKPSRRGRPPAPPGANDDSHAATGAPDGSQPATAAAAAAAAKSRADSRKLAA
jgi:hypothetical protein